MFWGIFLLITNNILTDNHYDDLIYVSFCILGYSFLTIFIIFSFLIFQKKLPDRLKKFEKIKYLLATFLLMLCEAILAAAGLPDLD